MTTVILPSPPPQDSPCAEDLTIAINGIGAQHGLPPLLLWSRDDDGLLTGLADFLQLDTTALGNVEEWARVCGTGLVLLDEAGVNATYTARITIGGRPAIVRATKHEVTA